MKKKHLIVGGIALVLLLIAGDVAAWNSALSNPVDDGDTDANVKAFLKMLQWCEGTFNQPNPYAVCYGYDHVIQDFSDHPAVTGEWTGKQLPNSYCYGAGLTPPCYSTAAGAYQFLKSTWVDFRDRYGIEDFSPASQSYACIQALDELGAYDFIIAGNLQSAINKASGYWASLPGNQAGQPQRTYAQCEQFYLSQGGNLAGTKQAVGSLASGRRGGVNLGRYIQL